MWFWFSFRASKAVVSCDFHLLCVISPTLPSVCVVVPVFSELSPEQLACPISHTRHLRCPPQKILCRQNFPCTKEIAVMIQAAPCSFLGLQTSGCSHPLLSVPLAGGLWPSLCWHPSGSTSSPWLHTVSPWRRLWRPLRPPRGVRGSKSC